MSRESNKKSIRICIETISTEGKENRNITFFLKKAAKEVIKNLPASTKTTRKVRLSLLFASKKHMRELNLFFRGVDSPTNVLSFPFFDKRKLLDERRKREGIYIGDIAICNEVAKREAEKNGKNVFHHIMHLFIHGVLHLLGYDHKTKKSAEQMEDMERIVMLKLGFPDPYEERGKRGSVRSKKVRIEKSKSRKKKQK